MLNVTITKLQLVQGRFYLSITVERPRNQKVSHSHIYGQSTKGVVVVAAGMPIIKGFGEKFCL